MRRRAHPFPFPCEYWPSFDTRHEARELIAQYQDAGHIKRCAHAVVRAVGGGYSGAEAFQPWCRQNSMIRKRGDYRESLFHGCPSDCHYYRAAWRDAAERRAASAWKMLIAQPIGGGWSAFTSLPATVQTVLALAVLVLVIGAIAPSVLPKIIEVIKAVRQ